MRGCRRIARSLSGARLSPGLQMVPRRRLPDWTGGAERGSERAAGGWQLSGWVGDVLPQYVHPALCPVILRRRCRHREQRCRRRSASPTGRVPPRRARINPAFGPRSTARNTPSTPGLLGLVPDGGSSRVGESGPITWMPSRRAARAKGWAMSAPVTHPWGHRGRRMPDALRVGLPGRRRRPPPCRSVSDSARKVPSPGWVERGPCDRPREPSVVRSRRDHGQACATQHRNLSRQAHTE